MAPGETDAVSTPQVSAPACRLPRAPNIEAYADHRHNCTALLKAAGEAHASTLRRLEADLATLQARRVDLINRMHHPDQEQCLAEAHIRELKEAYKNNMAIFDAEIKKQQSFANDAYELLAAVESSMMNGKPLARQAMTECFHPFCGGRGLSQDVADRNSTLAKLLGMKGINAKIWPSTYLEDNCPACMWELFTSYAVDIPREQQSITEQLQEKRRKEEVRHNGELAKAMRPIRELLQDVNTQIQKCHQAINATNTTLQFLAGTPIAGRFHSSAPLLPSKRNLRALSLQTSVTCH